MLRKKPLKRSKVQIKRKPIVQKPKSQEQIDSDKAQRDAMWELFEKHWQLTEQRGYWHGQLWSYHKCESCNEFIWGENKSLYHHHCWPKSKYPEYALQIDNLILLCAQCHTDVENGKFTVQGKEKIEAIKQKLLHQDTKEQE